MSIKVEVREGTDVETVGANEVPAGRLGVIAQTRTGQYIGTVVVGMHRQACIELSDASVWEEPTTRIRLLPPGTEVTLTQE